ncbi:hypothetical protein BDV28DRAFT_151727 [Aspergillus coremiiformis]|uniref:DUF7703 domain-containing protein n=1 Tax=Aspergillus coremiiformis TaxID=138285 RepID=A0A5N6YY83_9EURO|nr:hypothetical protein BDV28DRAFT_151727 [Aspergillus coremiiformis]
MAEGTEPLVFSPEITLIVVPLLAVALYNALELFYWIFSFFRRYRGCYFWSLTVATCGIIIFVTAVVLEISGNGPPPLARIAFPLGVFSMATGSVMVLYARMHLVTEGRTPQYVLYFIISTACGLHLPLCLMYLIKGFTTRRDVDYFSHKYEHVVIICSCARELLISGIYLWVAFRNLKPILDAKGREGRRVVRELIIVYIIVLLSDAALVAIDQTRHSAIKSGYAPVATSVKLKLEFAVLNKLINLVQTPPRLNRISSVRLSSENFALPSRAPGRLSDPEQDPRSTHDKSSHQFATVTRTIPSPPYALSYDHLVHSRPEHHITEASSSRVRARSPWRGRR